MVCRAGDKYVGKDRTNVSWSNWNGDVTFAPTLWRVPKHRPPKQRRHEPDATAPPPRPHRTDPIDGLSSLVEAVADATEKGQSVHAIGSGWAFEDCAKSDAVMVSLANLTSQLHDVVDPGNGALTDTWIGKQHPASATHLVHFEAGIRIADLCEQLDAQGLAMPTLGGSNGQSLAGAISTSTHGGDWQQPPFPDVVRAVHLVGVGGQEWWIESASNPLTRGDHDNEALLSVLPCKETKVVRDDRLFDAVRVACGRFGVIYSFVLEVRWQFHVVQVVTTPSAASVLEALRAGQGTPSVFTPLFRLLNTDPVPEGVDDAQGVPYFLQVLFNSQRPSDVWVTRRWETPNRNSRLDPPQGSKEELSRAIVAVANAGLLEVAGVAGNTVAAVTTAVLTGVLGPLGTVAGMSLGLDVSVEIVNAVVRLDELLMSGNAPFGSILAAALSAGWRVPAANYLIAQIQAMVIENELRGGLKKAGVRERHYLVTTGWRQDSDQDDFRSDSIELVFDATTTGYLDFLDEILPVAPRFQQAGYVSLRPSLRSTALLSMHNVSGKRAIAIEIASLKNLPGNAAWMSYVHQAAVRYGGRPHWGQYNKLDALSVAMLYGDSLNQWREALLGVNGTSTLFSNDFTRQRGLEPQGILREVTSVKKRGGTITHLCNDAASWSPVTVRDAIREIRRDVARYVARNGDYAALIKVVSDGHGGFYLRSQSDRTSADNLDNLPLSTRP